MDYIKFLSADRLSRYENIEQHHENLALIGRIAPKILLIEICLRNIIDTNLSKDNAEWLYHSNEAFVQEAIEKEAKRCGYQPTHSQLISRMSIGFWTRILGAESYKHKLTNIITIRDFDAKAYSQHNTNKIGKHKIRQYTKIRIIFGLFRILRNRAFHSENLYSINKETQRPNICVVFGKSSFRLDGCKIELFIRDILNSFDTRLEGELEYILTSK